MKPILSAIISRLATALLCLAAAVSCTDDDLMTGDGGVVDGRTRDVAVEITFEPESPRDLDTRASRAPGEGAQQGDCIQNISHLRILVYDAASGGLLHNMVIMQGGVTRSDGIISNVKYTDGADNRLPDEKDSGLADKASGRVTFNIAIPSAKYYIYAVANAPDITPAQVADREDMKNIARRWVPGRMADNSEMYGVFSIGPDRGATDASPVVISDKVVSLHCWLRRLASKVTVAFDGTELYDNVYVYIDSVSLYDIPQQCLLGNPNTAGRDYSSDRPGAMLAADAATRYAPGTNGLIRQGQYELVQTLPSAEGMLVIPENYIHVCNNSHAYMGKGPEGGDPDHADDRHGHSELSLFFYENLQGEGDPGCKLQDADGDKVIDNPHPAEGDPASGWKDGKPYGTYVQVHGHYRCTSNDGSVSSGPIVYRFMLGKDTDHDFNAERNTHYRLTLCLKGYGNDADWHIDYAYTRGITVNTPQFISYLYNKKMMASVKVAGDIPDGYYLRADIMPDVETWRPWGDGSSYLPKPAPGFATTEHTTDDGPWNSFLSLRQSQVIKIESEEANGKPSSSWDYATARRVSKAFYENSREGVRVYQCAPRETGYESNANGQSGMYFVTATRRNGSIVTERLFTIPLYTRPKELVTWSGFTGNNPYSQFARRERVRLSLVKSDDPTAKYETVAVPKTDPYYIEPVYLDVVQVPRIVNPKAVWRKGGSTDPFHVRLMQINPSNTSQFYAFNSVGKWSAEVVTASAPIITLSTTPEGSGSGNAMQSGVSRIEGDDEHPVDFIINFNGVRGYAAVRVRYHNYSCEHDIFCCNGYEQPVDVAGKGTRWSHFNVDYFKGDSVVLTTDPRQEGSLFRRCNPTAILASNNTLADFGVRHDPDVRKFDVLNSDGTTGSLTWNEIPAGGMKAWPITNAHLRIATGADFYELIAEKSNDIDFQINKAYGVLYGEGADSTRSTIEGAYQYNSLTGAESDRGMSGVIVYNRNTMRQIFLPIGQARYGHRKKRGGWSNNDTPGTLRYAGRSDRVTDVTMNRQRPLFYDLFERPGAVYWLGNMYSNAEAEKEGIKASAFDINFYTMGFEGYGNNAVDNSDGTNSDACFIRTVVK